jgi:uncharacterized protein (TIGR02001 family)
MSKHVVWGVAALALCAAVPAGAADLPVKAVKAPVVAAPPSPFDIAFGAAIMNDYVFRGVTQSDHKPSVAAYFEPRYNITPNLQLYAGISGESIKFANDAAAEIDFYGGVRPTIGPFAFDVGFWYYYYPGGTCFAGTPACPATIPNGNVAKADASFWEVYGKVTYTIGDVALGANEYYSPNFLNTGAWGNYLSGTIKYTAPERMGIGPFGWYVSAEFGRQWLGTSDAFYGTTIASPAGGGPFPNGIDYADYNTWNVGAGLTYKVFTLDLRYSDTDLSKADCNAFTSDPTATFDGSFSPINPTGVGSKWCGATFIAKLSADLTLGSLK